MGKFEAMLNNFNDACVNAQPGPDKNKDITSDTAFIALAAPSMEGKTQLAFVMKDVLPLYFPLSEAYNRPVGNNPQLIYRNFTDYACMLRDCALEDIKNWPQTSFSASDLLTFSQDKMFWTAGFLNALIELFSESALDSGALINGN